MSKKSQDVFFLMFWGGEFGVIWEGFGESSHTGPSIGFFEGIDRDNKVFLNNIM